MSKKERLEKEINFLQEEFRGYFLILLALLSGEAGLIYAVVSGDKPIYILYLAMLGLFFVIFLLSKVKKIKDNVYLKLNELEKE
jgi:hypothetical protein